MKIKIWTVCWMTLIVGMATANASTAPLTDAEVRNYMAVRDSKSTVIDSGNGGCVPGKSAVDVAAGGHLCPHNRLTANEIFVERLTNNVVRLLTADLRSRRAGSTERLVSWRSERQGYAIAYRALIRGGAVVNETAVLRFPGLATLKTVNGKLSGRSALSVKSICRMLHLLKQGGIAVKECYLLAPAAAAADFSALYRGLKDENYRITQLSVQGGQQNVYIRVAKE